MLTVADVIEPVRAVLGTCSSEEFYSKINEAIEELANLGNWDPMVMSMDICTDSCEITLPDDVEIPLAINVGGHPADFRNKWFEFHLNGPGTECCDQACNFNWTDKGDFPTFRNLRCPSQLVVCAEGAENIGASVRIYGFDGNEQWIMTPDANGVLQDGFEIPIIYGLNPGTNTTLVKRITRVSKPLTNNFIRLIALDTGSTSCGTLLGRYRPTDTEPSFRRITVSGGGCSCLTGCTGEAVNRTWVRMRFRRKVFKVSQLSDPIPLHSVTAIKMMAQAIKKYEADLLTEYAGYFSAAKNALEREQKSRSGPNQIKIQFQPSAYAGNNSGNMI